LKKLLLAATIAAFTVPALVAPEMKTTKHAALGCKSRADANKLLHLVLAKDVAAMLTFERLATRTGGCRWFEGGEELYVDQQAFSDAICMRPKGEVDCYWINSDWMTP
jgi:hypothetical protein